VEVLSTSEARVVQSLRAGHQVERADMLEMLNAKLGESQTLIRGFVLDLPLETADGEFWLSCLTLNKLKMPKVRNRPFSHVIEFVNSARSVLNHIDSIYESPENFRLFS